MKLKGRFTSFVRWNGELPKDFILDNQNLRMQNKMKVGKQVKIMKENEKEWQEFVDKCNERNKEKKNEKHK